MADEKSTAATALMMVSRYGGNVLFPGHDEKSPKRAGTFIPSRGWNIPARAVRLDKLGLFVIATRSYEWNMRFRPTRSIRSMKLKMPRMRHTSVLTSERNRRSGGMACLSSFSLSIIQYVSNSCVTS